jgi:hypothetical protein
MDSADLPESDLAREESDITRDVETSAGTVRYPITDREVRSAPPELADTVPPVSPPRADRPERIERTDRIVADEARITADETTGERRRAERRRIDRMSTDF